MKITVLTLFPEAFEGFINTSILKRATKQNLVEIEFVNIRDFTNDPNGRVDNPPIGGGAGLIMKCQPVLDALDNVKSSNSHTVLFSPRGKTYNEKDAYRFSKLDHLILIAGHYEGIDERVNDEADELISIGDYILTGGEIPALAVIDSVVRLLDGVITKDSLEDESFNEPLLEYPQYTEPRTYNNKDVPDILYSGNHEVIDNWRRKQSFKLTKKYRPDLYEQIDFTKKDKKLLKEINTYGDSYSPKEELAIEKGRKFMKKQSK